MSAALACCLLALCAAAITAQAGGDGCREQVAACRAVARGGGGGDGGRVCGSDGRTYGDRCALLQAQCRKPKAGLALRHTGPCVSEMRRSCTEEARRARLLGSEPPRCRRDGRYAARQCSRGRCWCVAARGQLRTDRTPPHCRPPPGVSRRPRHRARPVCKPPDKRHFNNNLIKKFRSEWTRVTGGSDVPGTDEADIDIIVLEWKFSTLDVNSNDMLDASEYADLKKIVKKIVKPKHCARLFGRACDVNRDQEISRAEWADCLSRDGIDDDALGRPQPDLIADNDDTDEEDSSLGDDLRQLGGLNHPRVLQSRDGGLGSSQNSQNTGEADCLIDRRTGLTEHQPTSMYVPECEPDGRYKRVQCYSDYCWCVNPDTGKNIPGTSLKNATPQCESAADRPLRGCPPQRKAQFLKDLFEFLETKMDHEQQRRAGSSTDIQEEQAASWAFTFLDKNKNKMLERREWKTFRALVTPVRALRHCGKKLPRHCDFNRDKRISVPEWMSCLGVNTRSSSGRVGPNPLEYILKSD